MYDILKLCIGFLVDTSKKIAHKIVLILSVVLIAYLINNIFGLTYYFNTSRKIEELKNISELLRDSTLSKEDRNYLMNEKKYLIERKNIIQKTIAFFNSKPKVDTTKRTKIDKNNNVVQVKTLNPLIAYLSGSIFFLFLIPVIPYMLFTNMAREKNFENAGGAIVSSIVMGFLCYWMSKAVLTEVLLKCPVFFNQPVLNYILFFLVNIILIAGTIKIIIEEKKSAEADKEYKKQTRKTRY